MEERNLILAVDGGGSSSQGALYSSGATEPPSVVMRMEIGPLSLKSSSAEIVLGNLAALRESLRALERHISIAVLGLSGLDTEEDFNEMISLMHECGFIGAGTGERRDGYVRSLYASCGYPIVLCSDAILPMFACGIDQGAVLIAGTGSIALRIYPDGEIRRLGGWGYRASDEGSGYWIGTEFMREALRVAEDILAASPEHGSLMPMPEVIRDAWVSTVGSESGSLTPPNARIAASDLCLWSMRHDDPKDYARIAFTALESHTPETASVLGRAAGALARIASLACRDCSTLVISGGLFKSQRFESAVRMAIKSASSTPITVLRPTLPLTYGGYELGKALLRKR